MQTKSLIHAEIFGDYLCFQHKWKIPSRIAYDRQQYNLQFELKGCAKLSIKMLGVSKTHHGERRDVLAKIQKYTAKTNEDHTA